jgi:hypothetical protein
LPSAGAVHSHGVGLRFYGINFGSSGADDLIGGAEDFLRALFRYPFGIQATATVDPTLNISTTEGGSLKSQRFTTEKRHGFRFDLAQTSRRRLSIGEISLGGVA